MIASKNIFLRLMFLFWGASSLFSQTNTIRNVLAVEQTRFDAMIRSDTNLLSYLLGNELIYIHSNALKEDKKGHIRSISSGKIVYQQMTREEPTVRTFRKIAVTTGVINVKGIISGNPFDVKMFYTAIYKKRQHRWLLVHWQSTRLP
jgi:hypothetical protein